MTHSRWVSASWFELGCFANVFKVVLLKDWLYEQKWRYGDIVIMSITL